MTLIKKLVSYYKTYAILNVVSQHHIGLEMGMNFGLDVHASSLAWHHRRRAFPSHPPTTSPSHPCALLSSSCDCPVAAGVCAFLLHLLWHLSTQMKRWGRDSYITAFEWAAAEGGGEDHTLLLCWMTAQRGGGELCTWPVSGEAC